MYEFMKFIWFAGLVLHFIVSLKFGSIAEQKGYKNYGWWCIFFGFVGWLMVIALPDKKAQKNTDDIENCTRAIEVRTNIIAKIMDKDF